MHTNTASLSQNFYTSTHPQDPWGPLISRIWSSWKPITSTSLFWNDIRSKRPSNWRIVILVLKGWFSQNSNFTHQSPVLLTSMSVSKPHNHSGVLQRERFHLVPNLGSPWYHVSSHATRTYHVNESAHELAIFCSSLNLRMQNISIKTAAIAAATLIFLASPSHSRFLYSFFVFFWSFKGQLCHNSKDASCSLDTNKNTLDWKLARRM